MSTAAQPFCRHARDYGDLVQAVRDRSEQMEMSRLELDRLVGLADGHSSKLLQPQPKKKFGMITLGPTLATLGLVLVVMEDPNARDKTLARRKPFNANNRRVGNKCHLGKERQSETPTAAKVEPPKPHSNEPASRAHLRVIQPRHKGARWGGSL